jgi:hypothetical protein
MNMVALLSLGFVMRHSLEVPGLETGARSVGVLAIFLCLGLITWALVQSRNEIKQQARGSRAFLSKG